jgi:integrase
MRKTNLACRKIRKMISRAVCDAFGTEAVMKAWIARRGTTWVCYWNDTDGKRRQKSFGSDDYAHGLAMTFRKKKDAELLLGIQSTNGTATWQEFRRKYHETSLAIGSTARVTRNALDRFEKLIRPGKVCNITSETIAKFIAALVQERGKQPGSRMELPTVNKYLRHLRAVLQVAADWEYLPKLPKFRFLKGDKKLPDYMLPEHFAAIYQACRHAKRPESTGYTACEWWQALIMTAYVTGLRIGELLNLRRDDVDLDKSFAIIRHTKGKQDAIIGLLPVAVEHMQRLRGFSERFFAWDECQEYLYDEWHAIQDRAGIGRQYGFHAIRKAFGTMNAPRISASGLKLLMRHESIETTMRYYVNPLAEQQELMGRLFVPPTVLSSCPTEPSLPVRAVAGNQ